ncbi:hypothetical protein D3C71_1409690 [compost metagenome]
MAGMSVARKFCKNRYITTNTSTTASINVLTTSSMEMRTKGVVSYGLMTFMPWGKNLLSSASLASTALTVLSAFAPVASLMARPAAGLPLKRATVS